MSRKLFPTKWRGPSLPLRFLCRGFLLQPCFPSSVESGKNLGNLAKAVSKKGFHSKRWSAVAFLKPANHFGKKQLFGQAIHGIAMHVSTLQHELPQLTSEDIHRLVRIPQIFRFQMRLEDTVRCAHSGRVSGPNANIKTKAN